MVDLGTLGGSESRANGINPRGQIVGGGQEVAERLPSGEIPTHPFLWDKGVMIDLGTLGGNQAGASAINPAGWIVGQSETADRLTHAFVWKKGVMTDLGTLGGDL